MHRKTTWVIAALFILTIIPLTPTSTAQTYTPLTNSQWSDLMSLCADWVQWNVENPPNPAKAVAWGSFNAGTAASLSNTVTIPAGAYCLVSDGNGVSSLVGSTSALKYTNLCTTDLPNLIPGCVGASLRRTTTNSELYVEIVEYSASKIIQELPEPDNNCGFSLRNDFVIDPDYFQVGPGAASTCNSNGGYVGRGIWTYSQIKKISLSLSEAKMPLVSDWAVRCSNTIPLVSTITLGQGMTSGYVYIGAAMSYSSPSTSVPATATPKVTVSGPVATILNAGNKIESGTMFNSQWNANMNYAIWRISFWTSDVNNTAAGSVLTISVEEEDGETYADDNACFIAPKMAGGALDRYVRSTATTFGTSTISGLYQTWSYPAFKTDIQFTIKNETGSLIPNAGVALTAFNTGVKSCVTDSVGFCAISEVYDSNIDVSLTAEGYSETLYPITVGANCNGSTSCPIELIIKKAIGETIIGDGQIITFEGSSSFFVGQKIEQTIKRSKIETVHLFLYWLKTSPPSDVISYKWATADNSEQVALTYPISGTLSSAQSGDYVIYATNASGGYLNSKAFCVAVSACTPITIDAGLLGQLEEISISDITESNNQNPSPTATENIESAEEKMSGYVVWFSDMLPFFFFGGIGLLVFAVVYRNGNRNGDG